MKSDQESERLAIGIDLGTTFSCASIYWNSKVEAIPGNDGSKTLASIAVFEDGTLEAPRVGKTASLKASRFPKLTVYDAKRIIGRRFDDVSVKEFQKRTPLQIVDNGGMAAFALQTKNGQTLIATPEKVCSHFLKTLKQAADHFSGKSITDAVITVPAHFNDRQRTATKEAAEMAGLSVLRLLNEPTAAAFAYAAANQSNSETTETVAVVDFGGGTIDVTIMTTGNGNVEIKSSHGDCWVGGRDVDYNVLRFLEDEGRFGDLDLKKPQNNFKAVTACQDLKISLSLESNQISSTVIEVGDSSLELEISRLHFDTVNEQLFRKVISCLEEALKGSKLTKDRIDQVLLVGGSGRILKIREKIKDFFNGRVTPNASIHPDEAISMGAALVAAKIMDMAQIKNLPELYDVLNHSVGIGLHNQGVDHVIRKNSRLPAQETREYQTSVDDQTSINVVVCEGEGRTINDTEVLGTFTIEGIPPKPKGEITIRVTFSANSDGILVVTAQSDNHNIRQSLTIQKHLTVAGNA